MGSDDGTIGRVLTRREALALLGAGGLAALGAGRAVAAAPPGACVARPALTEGPYFVDARLERSDIRSDPTDGTLRPGTPLRLALRVSRLSAGACAPLPGAMVDVWHCDAAGVYSDVADPGGSTVGRKFLRGYQTTGDDALTDQVHARAPYAGPGARRMRNGRDGIYREAGAQLTLAVAPSGAGYAGAFDLALEVG